MGWQEKTPNNGKAVRMTTQRFLLAICVACVGLLLVLPGCGGGDDRDGDNTSSTTNTPASANSLAGTWSGSWLDSIRTVHFTMPLSEDDHGDASGSYQEAGGITGSVTGHRDGTALALTVPLSDGTFMTIEGSFADANHVAGQTVIHYMPSGTSMSFHLSMLK
jgi:hypothetical protein